MKVIAIAPFCATATIEEVIEQIALGVEKYHQRKSLGVTNSLPMEMRSVLFLKCLLLSVFEFEKLTKSENL